MRDFEDEHRNGELCWDETDEDGVHVSTVHSRQPK
ncbi:hypothetical protein BJY24_002782 [Nocardia transvalensis]|uniref:Uncharacterized protein n=1 Tax=Nocardia transvalensis TaxID=37333 RepID=A0A7W9PDG1_9NOCA|nr:hypothetical protein [Nocardia transvalensis]